MVTKPREEGGMGVHTTESRNTATHTSMAWRMFNNPNALWVKVLFHEHCTGRNPTRHIASRTWQNVKNG